MSRARDIADTGDNNLDDIVVDGSGNLDVTGTVTADGLTVDTDTLYVDSTNNRVGIGTSSPSTPFGTGLEVSATSVTGGVKVGRSDASIAGGLSLLSGSTTHSIYGEGAKELNFWTNATKHMTIDSSGNVLVGSSSPFTGGADNSGGTGAVMIARDNERCLFLKRAGGNGAVAEFIRGGITSPVGSISVTTSSTAYNTSSDYRLKENVVADWDATTRLKQLNPVRFNFIADADTTVDGFLAHEVQNVVPEAITGTHNEVDDEGNPVYQGIDQSKLVPLLVKTIQELEARIAALEAN